MKEDQLLLAVEDPDSGNAILSQGRLPVDENSPLLQEQRERAEMPGGSARYEISDDLPWYRRPSVFWLLAPFALSALAFGGIIVPKVNLVLSLICDEYMRDESMAGPKFDSPFEADERCRIPEVQARVATFKLCMSSISGCLAAIVAPKLGALSDRYGRTPMLVYINCGMILSEVITIFAAMFPKSVSVYWILFGSVFDGLGGTFISSMAISHSYAADCTSPEKRSIIFAYFHGCMYTGVALGPLIAGYIIKVTGNIISMFYLACGFHLFFVLMLLVVIPESVPKARQLAAREKYSETLDSTSQDWRRQLYAFNLFEPLKILYGPGNDPAIRRNLILLASTDTIVFGVAMGANVVILLYSNFAFGWDQWEQSKFTSIVNTCRVSCLLLVLPSVTHWYRNRQARRLPNPRPAPRDPHMHTIEGTDQFELSVIRFAIFADSLGFLGYTLSKSGTAFILSGAVTSIGGVGSPTMQAALTKHVAKENVGQLLGAMGLLHAVGRVVGPLIFTGIYAATVGVFSEAYFVVLTLMFGVAFVVSWFVRPIDPRTLMAHHQD